MNRSYCCLLLCWVLLGCGGQLCAQSIFVDAIHGNDGGDGTRARPLASLENAINAAGNYTGQEPVTILVAPGLYTLERPLRIKPSTAEALFTVQAMVMPGDTGWTPSKMPVIQCVSDANREGRLPHASIAFQVMRNAVAIRGVKFLGNPHPLSQYYYAIERNDSTLKGLEISQCYFIGDRYSAPMQGGIFAQGSDIRVDHCVFYGCKNAVLVFLGLRNFSLTHSIIYGAYEGALWYGYRNWADSLFTFDHNIVAGSRYVFVGAPGHHPHYTFRHSVITGNTFYMGFNGDTISKDLVNKPHEIGILNSGKVRLKEITADGVPLDYLQPVAGSLGADLGAGVGGADMDAGVLPAKKER